MKKVITLEQIEVGKTFRIPDPRKEWLIFGPGNSEFKIVEKEDLAGVVERKTR